jgi:hypothetical protein
MREREESFARLLARQPTDKDRQTLYRARDHLKLRPTDSFWDLLMTLDYYRALYEEIPGRIEDAAKNATKTVRATAEAQVAAAREETRNAMADAVRDGAIQVAKEIAGAERLKWASVGFALGIISLLVVGVWEHRQGETKGRAAAEVEAKRECEYATKAASWANTPNGQRAYALEKAGSLHELVNCTGRALEKRGDWCIVQTDRGKPVYRWRLSGS